MHEDSLKTETAASRSRWFHLSVFAVVAILGFSIGWLELHQRDLEDQSHITITKETIELIKDQWERQVGQKPSEDEFQLLLDQYVLEEMTVREAMKLGLDQHDSIIRRRLVQKLEFVTVNKELSEGPTEQELEDYFQLHKNAYRLPQRVDFMHVFFSGERREDPAGDAKRALDSISPQNWHSFGDPFLLRRSFADIAYSEITREFGSSFETVIRQAALRTWEGPVTSVYGFHLIYVVSKKDSPDVRLDDVRDQVHRDFLFEKSEAEYAAYVDELKRKYKVTIEQ